MMMSFDYNYQNAFRCNLCNADLCHARAILHKRKLASKHSCNCSQMTSSCKCPIEKKSRTFFAFPCHLILQNRTPIV